MAFFSDLLSAGKALLNPWDVQNIAQESYSRPTQTFSGGGGSWGPTPVSANTNVINSGGGGGGGGYRPQPTNQGVPIQDLLQETPPQPDMNPFQGEIDAAIGSLRDLEGRFQGELPNQLANIDQGYQTGKAGIEAEQATRAQEFAQQRQAAENVGQYESGKQQRLTGELMTGIASRFGGGTGTGQFTSEILGRQGLENLGLIRNTVLDTIGKINVAKSQIDDKAMSLKAQLFTESEQLKQKARDQLNLALMQIRSQSAQLGAAKGDMALQALNQYQNMVANIQARNTQFLQDISTAAAQGKLLLTGFQNTARDRYTAQINGLSNFDMGSLQVQPYGYDPSAASRGYVTQSSGGR